MKYDRSAPCPTKPRVALDLDHGVFRGPCTPGLKDHAVFFVGASKFHCYSPTTRNEPSCNSTPMAASLNADFFTEYLFGFDQVAVS